MQSDQDDIVFGEQLETETESVQYVDTASDSTVDQGFKETLDEGADEQISKDESLGDKLKGAYDDVKDKLAD